MKLPPGLTSYCPNNIIAESDKNWDIYLRFEPSPYQRYENKLPAICFVFSRKNCEYYAAGIETCLFSEEDAILDNTIDTECRNVIAKLPNYKEYLELPEYINCVKLRDQTENFKISVFYVTFSLVLRLSNT